MPVLVSVSAEQYSRQQVWAVVERAWIRLVQTLHRAIERDWELCRLARFRLLAVGR